MEKKLPNASINHTGLLKKNITAINTNVQFGTMPLPCAAPIIVATPSVQSTTVSVSGGVESGFELDSSICGVAFAQGLAEVSTHVAAHQLNMNQDQEGEVKSKKPAVRSRKIKEGENPLNRTKNEHLWKCNVRKARRNTGQSYITTKGKVVEGSSVQGKKAARASVNITVTASFPLNGGRQIFNSFWDLGSYARQREFIARHIERVNKKRHTNKDENSRRKWTIQYFLTAKG